MMFTYVSLVSNEKSKGIQMAGVNVKLVDGTMGIATAGPHAIVVDRSLANGGTYLGMVGGELLFTAIGTCLMTTLIGAARARNIELTKVEFDVSGVHEDAPSRFTSIDIAAVVEADATQEEIDKLLAIAERACTISNTVSRSAPITVRRTVAEAVGV
jgi:putative redox protein